MLTGFGTRSEEKDDMWKLVLAVILLAIAVYELLGVIYVRVSERSFKVEYTKLLQSLVSLFLVGYLAVTVKVIGTFFRDATSCLLLSNVIWFGYLLLSTMIHIFYWMKQRVLSKAIGTTVFWWLRPLQVFCIFLIIVTLILGILSNFPTSKSYEYENNMCTNCPSDGVTEVIMYVSLDSLSVLLLLMLFVLPMWRFMQEYSYMSQSHPLRRALIRNVFLCSIAVCVTLLAWLILYLIHDHCGTHTSVNLATQSLIWAVEQFLTCNCILCTMTDWQKHLLWPFVLASEIITPFSSLNSNMKEQKEPLLTTVNQ